MNLGLNIKFTITYLAPPKILNVKINKIQSNSKVEKLFCNMSIT
ncbi:hypothetical protein MSIBF_A1350007 [groundwater metagenome]|uniref:Uncharacterized protein n=1 Tax=groundwater metagenome TaxID=717931 RepID=A0A098E711_9ZZZZ